MVINTQFFQVITDDTVLKISQTNQDPNSNYPDHKIMNRAQCFKISFGSFVPQKHNIKTKSFIFVFSEVPNFK